MVQVAAKIMRSPFLGSSRNFFVLHDNLHGLASGRAVMSSCGGRRQIRRELAHPFLGERGFRNQDQHQYAHALSPSGAMALAPIPALWFKCLRHKILSLSNRKNEFRTKRTWTHLVQCKATANRLVASH